MNPQSRVLVAGSANLDFVVAADRIPAPGETVLGRGFRTFPGGKGANQAVAAARAGAEVSLLAALGEDPPAQVLEASLRAAGVQLELRRQAALPTGVAFICVADGENAITVAPGANAALVADDLPELAGVGYLLLQLETPLDTVLAYAERARAAGVTVVLNAAPAQPLPPALLEAVDLLVVNEGELAMLAGDTRDLVAAIARLGVARVVVTLGAAGCVASEHGQVHLQPAFRVEAIDTTAAGDTFCGVLVAALAEGHGMAPALRIASAASALTCTAAGAQSSIPGRAAIEALLQLQPDHAADLAAPRDALS